MLTFVYYRDIVAMGMREADVRNKRSTEDVAMGIRRRVFEHSMRNNGGYLSQACSAAEQLAFLYNEALNLGEPVLPAVPRPFAGVPSADNPDYVTGAGYNGPFEPQYDRLFIAPAHYALVAYATLIETGRMDAGRPGDVQQGRLVGRDDRRRAFSPGMEVHNGTLGIGLSTGAGLAWGASAAATAARSASSCPMARSRKARPGKRCRRPPITASTISGR
jgi:transketolase